MKKKQFLCVLLLVSLLALLSGCSDNKPSELDNARDLLSEVYDELRTMKHNCEFAQEDGDYEYMREELGIQQIKCEDLEKKINDFLVFGHYKLEKN